ncbi:MAG: enoyl-CoA hydratase/isomerase family protein [Phycisphaerales bacterium]|nr:enoyl-CoA hydratase/isomerase family protein [Phycisphaerales bacterium]
MAQLAQLTRIDAVARITLNRPEKRNALSIDLINALHASLDALEAEPDVRTLILAGAGRSFCAGMDLRGVVDDANAMADMLHGLAKASARIRALPFPTIAHVQGAAVGGGCGLAVVCDLAMTHPEAKLGYPEVTLGVCPAVVAPWLIRKVGAGQARAMLLQGGTMSGEVALRCGLVDHCVAADTLEQAVLDRAQSLAKGGAQAMATTKQWLNELDGSIDSAMLSKAADLSAQVIGGNEAQERLKPLFGD